MTINEQEIKSQLIKEGFGGVFTYQDDPNFEYARHTHEKSAVHVILEGSMTLTDAEGAKELLAGERINIPAGTVHSAKMGPRGCKYIVGEK